jgi:hypothetical protein
MSFLGYLILPTPSSCFAASMVAWHMLGQKRLSYFVYNERSQSR